MKKMILPLALGLGLAMAAVPEAAAQQGKGGGKRDEAHGQSHGQGSGHGQHARGSGQGRRETAAPATSRGRSERPRAERRNDGSGRGSARATTRSGTRTETRATTRRTETRATTRSTARRTETGVRWTDRRSRLGTLPRVASRGRNGEGPSFCRSGAGHPQFGRQWCLDKGFGLGSGAWSRAGWNDVRFRTSRRTGTLDRGGLADVLGSVVLGRMLYGVSGPVAGRWVSYGSGPVVLQLYSGSTPLAEMADYNRDGRADLVLVNLGRR
ncbi:MAG TPA: hypothetical protein VFQ45_07000 [Longimicrobium sp.]|nr:hypothetical protein [Longimicrobium sp.]